jgi:isopentenyl diphosphate isomerase/L-lactate dehydrogenase-like FMN-dependent dehydrogenase
MDPLKENGADGVQKRIEEITAEMASVMARTCSGDIRHIDPSVIWKK